MVKSAEISNLQNSADHWKPLVIYQVVTVFRLNNNLVSLICSVYHSYIVVHFFYGFFTFLQVCVINVIILTLEKEYFTEVV